MTAPASRSPIEYASACSPHDAPSAGGQRADVVRAPERGGFYVHHIKGSHCALRHPEKRGLRVVLPLHRKDPPAGTVRAIIRQAGLTVDEFIGLL